MKKSLKYSGAIVAALLAVAPVVVNNSAVVNANSTTQVAKKSQPGDSKDNPIKLTLRYDVSNIKAGDLMDINHENNVDVVENSAHLYADGQLLTKGTNGRQNCIDGGDSISPKDKKDIDDYIFREGHTYTIEGGNISQLKPNTWYTWTDNYRGKTHTQQTDSDGYMVAHDELGNVKDFKNYENYGISSDPVTFIVGKNGSKVINEDQSKDNSTNSSISKDDHKSDSTTNTSPSTPATDASSSSKSDSSKDTSSTSTSTTTPSTSHSTVDSNSEISSSTPISNPSIDKKNEVTSSKSDNEPAAEVSNSKTTTSIKTSSTKRVLAHNAYVYTNKGKLAKKNKKHILLKKGATVDTFGKQLTIKGKKFYKIAKNQYVKVANFVTGSKAIKVKVTATVKGKKNAKVSTYTSTGKLTKKHVYGKKTYKFNQKKTIKGKTYYKLTAKNQWVLANKLALKK